MVPVAGPDPDPDPDPDPEPEPLGLVLVPPVLLPLPVDPEPIAPVRSSCRAICDSVIARSARRTASSRDGPADWLRIELTDSRKVSEARSSRCTGSSLEAIDPDVAGEALLAPLEGEAAEGEALLEPAAEGEALLAPDVDGELLLAPDEDEAEGAWAAARPVASPREIANRVGFSCITVPFKGKAKREGAPAHPRLPWN